MSLKKRIDRANYLGITVELLLGALAAGDRRTAADRANDLLEFLADRDALPRYESVAIKWSHGQEPVRTRKDNPE